MDILVLALTVVLLMVLIAAAVAQGTATDGDGAGRFDPVEGGLVPDGPPDHPVPIPTRPGLLLPEDD